MSDQQRSETPFADADEQWLDLIASARQWFNGPYGQLLLESQQSLLEEELARFFGSYMLHYGPTVGAPPQAAQIQHTVRVGAPFAGMDIACEEQAWPMTEHAADVVLLQHGLDFSLSPHGLLREAAHSVRPGGHLLIVGINPASCWGLRHMLTRDALHQARCISSNRVCDWLRLLGFALEKRRFGCYRPPLASRAWQKRLAPLESWASAWQAPTGGFYLLVARKMVVGLRPLRESRREPMAGMVPMPVAKVSRCDGDKT
ncbi:SAM-dependent methyltransferase [Pseudomonas sp. EL_65y_Pfl2_R95]|uniref:SAM-dependent methyltransferase n=1 Tax=Pseudomonas sp. EL_65y_Pfl2_R95 TaxID=3088698 RepID=UPI0030D9A9C8